MDVLRPVRETESELCFRNDSAGGWLTAGCGAGVVVAGQIAGDAEWTWVSMLIGLIAMLGGIHRGLRQIELRLRLQGRTYVLRRRRRLRVDSCEGSLDEIPGLRLFVGERTARTTRAGRRRHTSHEVWTILLQLPGHDDSFVIHTTKSRNGAYHRIEHYSKLLGIPALDMTGRPDLAPSVEEFERVETDARRLTACTPCDPPPGSRIRWHNRPGNAAFELAPAGLRGGWKGMLAGVMVLVVVAALVLALALRDDTEGLAPMEKVIATAVCTLVGLVGFAIIAISLLASYLSMTFEEVGSFLENRTWFLGRLVHSRRLAKADVEEVSVFRVRRRARITPGRQPRPGIDADPDPRETLVLRIRVRGEKEPWETLRGMEREALDWACGALRYILVRGRDATRPTESGRIEEPALPLR